MIILPDLVSVTALPRKIFIARFSAILKYIISVKILISDLIHATAQLQQMVKMPPY